MPRIVALCGSAGSGKSTAAEFLVRKHHYARLSYAAPIKKMILCLLTEAGVGPLTAKEMIVGKFKEDPHDALAGHSPRYAMQTLGTEWGRERMAQDFWRRILLRKAKQLLDSGIDVVVDDLRFPDEAEALKALGALIVRIERPVEAVESHASEQQDFPVDVVIDNTGSIGELEKNVWGIA